MTNKTSITKVLGTCLLAFAGINSANAAMCQGELNELFAAEAYADSVCSEGASEGCNAAQNRVEYSFRDYAECMALDSFGPL